MIRAIFGRWVHPWRRPAAEAKRSVRLSAPSARTVSSASPLGPEAAPVYDFVPLDGTVGSAYDRYALKGVDDVVVFGPQYSLGGRKSAPDQYCPCGASWAVGTAAECWSCGRPV